MSEVPEGSTDQPWPHAEHIEEIVVPFEFNLVNVVCAILRSPDGAAHLKFDTQHLTSEQEKQFQVELEKILNKLPGLQAAAYKAFNTVEDLQSGLTPDE